MCFVVIEVAATCMIVEIVELIAQAYCLVCCKFMLQHQAEQQERSRLILYNAGFKPVLCKYGKIDIINNTVFVNICAVYGLMPAANKNTISSLYRSLIGYRVV